MSGTRFIHTADWQIGRSFRGFADQAESLREVRLDAIDAIGRLALEVGARKVFVAGDVYDTEVPNDRSLRAPLERMRPYEAVTWYLLPGNHDPHRPGGVWERVVPRLPDNVRAVLTAEPIDLGTAALLPAPLVNKAVSRDPTAWMDQAVTPEGKPRIGLAHGAIQDFGSQDPASNKIDARRAELAGLGYLALGDWHKTLKIDDRTWYSGTPEADRHGSQEIGQVLLVDVDVAGRRVEPRAVGRYRWGMREEQLADSRNIERLIAVYRSMDDLHNRLERLALVGSPRA